jgi:hypothetical protein
MGQGPSFGIGSAAAPAPSSSFARLSRDEVQLLFSFLDWRSKLALARCNRTLLGDCDSVLAWADSDGLSAFSAAGVIELNLALLTDEQTISDAATKSLAGRRGRVRLLYRHGSVPVFGKHSCRVDIWACLKTFRRTAEWLPRLHGLGPLCRGCCSHWEWVRLFNVVTQLPHPLAELRVDDFSDSADPNFGVVVHAVRAALSPAMAPHLRALSLHGAWIPEDHANLPRYVVFAALTELPQLTVLECSSQLWNELVELQPDSALHGQLQSLSINCTSTSLGSVCQSLGNHRLTQLRVLRLYGVLQLVGIASASRHWGSLLPALPQLDTLALHFDSANTIDEALPYLFPDAVPSHSSLRTLSLRMCAEMQRTPLRPALAQALSRCPQLHLQLHLAPLHDFRAKFLDDQDWQWAHWCLGQAAHSIWRGLPRTTWTTG